MNKVRKVGLVIGAVGWVGMFLMSETMCRFYQGAKARIFKPSDPGDLT